MYLHMSTIEKTVAAIIKKSICPAGQHIGSPKKNQISAP
jgi:hypothetical protein